VRNAVRFLAKFVLASAILYMLWTPFSRVYSAILSVEANAVFSVLGHHARYVSDHRGPHILYPDIFPPYKMKTQIRLPILQSIAMEYNLIVLVALFAATPGMPRGVRFRGIAVGVLVLSLLEIAHIYCISYLFIWDYVDFRRWPDGVPQRILNGLVENARASFPWGARPYIRGFNEYWNHFLREAASLLIWVYFAYPLYKGVKARKD
jgi:hypothetical protein